MFAFGPLAILERVDLLGIAVFLAVLPPDDAHRTGMVRSDPDRVRRALFALRLLVGGALVLVAFTEKLLRPEILLEFLEQYPFFNVAQLVGLPVGHEQFVVIAAGIEILLGLLLISGALPQLVALTAAAPFTLPIAFLGVPELLGHLPIYGVLLAMAVYGSRADTAALCSWLPRLPVSSRRRVPSARVEQPQLAASRTA